MISTLQRRLRQTIKVTTLMPTPVFRHGLRHGVAAAIEHRKLLKGIPLATLIDVGANVGQFSLLARSLHPNLRIHAFEPLQRPAKKFALLFDGDPLTTLYRCAIGPETVECSMNIAGRDDSSSLLQITEEQVRFAPGTEKVGTEHVSVKRLDDVLNLSQISGPSMLKLDVQGFELAALRGCGALLDAIDFVYVEVSFVVLYLGQALVDEIMQFLFAHHFSLVAVNNPAFDGAGRGIQADFLFQRRKPADAPAIGTAATVPGE